MKQIQQNGIARRVALGSLAFLLALALSENACAARIMDLCDVQGARGNDLKGIGLVVGLSATGDKSAEAVRAQQRLLSRLDVEVASYDNLKSDNCAVVLVTGTFPAFAKEGTQIDVQISSLFDCKSLEGGILLETQLTGADDEVYAVAQGAVSVGGLNATGGGAKVRKNYVTVGRIPMGAYIEREIPSTITDGERMSFLLKNPDFGTASKIVTVINAALGSEQARALGAGTVNVVIPKENQGDLITFIAQLQSLSVEPVALSRVVINERTGTIVVGGEVAIRPCQVAHGDLVIEVATTPVFPESGALLPDERKGEVTDVKVKEQPAHFLPISGASASEVAVALNKLKVTPRDMIAIFQALREAGALDADLDIM